MIGKHILTGGSTFYADGLKYCLKHRKKPTTKPELYLIQVVPAFKYISSVFQLENNKFYMEFEGIEYELNIDGNSIEIDLKE